MLGEASPEEGEVDVDAELAARARALAAPLTDDRDDLREIYLLTSVGPCRVALPARCATHVVALPAITRVPGAPAAMVGVAVALGALLPVADAALLLGVDPTGGPSRRIVVLSDGDDRLGLLVDEVEGLEPLDLVIAEPGDVVAAETPDDHRLLRPTSKPGVFVLDVDALYRDDRLWPHDQPHSTQRQGVT